MRRIVHRLAGLVMILLLLIGAVPAISAHQATPSASPEAVGSAGLPDTGDSVLFGVDLDWGRDSLADYGERLGETPYLSYLFLPYPLNDDAIAAFEQVTSDVAAAGGALMVALQPSVTLDKLSAADAQGVAELAISANLAGVPLLIDFASQMNGSWFAYGLKPTQFVPAYRLFVNTVRETAPGALFVWSPAYAGGYPFVTREYLPDPKSDDFALLDTNGDDEITMADDPYAPFYPGDDYVDWIGMTLNHWGNAYPWQENEIPESGKLLDQMHGKYNGLNGDSSALPDFYADYVEATGKPFVLRTAALYLPDEKGDSELKIKRAWWRQVLSEKTFDALPGLDAVIWEEWIRPEFETNNQTVDWRVTAHSSIRKAFVKDLPEERLVFAPGGGS